MKFHVLFFAALLFSAFSFAERAEASTVTHSSFSCSGTACNIGGFTYTAGAGRHWHTGSLLHHGHSNSPATLTFGGNAFSLLSFTGNGVTQVVGSNGYTIGNGVSSLSNSAFNFGTNLVGVTSVMIRGHFSIDNVKLDTMPVSPVPLPAGGALLIGGLAVIGLARRRSSKT